MKRFPFLAAIAATAAGAFGYEATRGQEPRRDVTIRGVRATAHAFKNSKGEIIAALDEHGNLGIRGAIRSKEITGGVEGA